MAQISGVAEFMIKLNTNENPYPPAPGVIRALKEFSFFTLRYFSPYTCASFSKAGSEFLTDVYKRQDQTQIFQLSAVLF